MPLPDDTDVFIMNRKRITFDIDIMWVFKAFFSVIEAEAGILINVALTYIRPLSRRRKPPSRIFY